jgi:hypothetical protein
MVLISEARKHEESMKILIQFQANQKLFNKLYFLSIPVLNLYPKCRWTLARYGRPQTVGEGEDEVLEEWIN